MNISSATLETVKFVLRMIILYTPLVLAFLLDWQSHGIWFAVSTALAALDKGIHESKNTSLNGLVPF